MKLLFEKQREAVDFHKQALLIYRASLDSSLTGVGKTVIAAHVAKEFGRPVAVVCPKIVVPHWRRELADAGVDNVIFIINYEKLKRGGEFIRKVGRKTYRWQLPDNALIIWDEVHKCKAPNSQNSAMLIAAASDGHYYNLMLSATACQDPTEMRAIGYALKLHSLNKSTDNLRSWYGWMMSYGCRRDQWQKWVAGPVSKLKQLNQEMYTKKAIKLTPRDLPNAFADNHIITEPLAFSALSDIKKYYDELGITPEIVDMMLDGTAGSSEVLVQILRARQLAEAAKVPDIVEMIDDAIAEGYSVAVFVNFVDTVRMLVEATKHDPAIIIGGQDPVFREQNINEFQTNQKKLIICNIAAGGVGVSLHDTDGNYPRMSLISPTFNVKDYIQTLGRIHRAGAKSPATQKILIASKTIEEKVLTKLEEKRMSMDTLHAALNEIKQSIQ